MLAARFSREALHGVRWRTADAATVVNDTSEQLTLRTTGSTKALAPLDLAAEPEVRAVVDAIEADELVTRSDEAAGRAATTST